MQAEIKDLKIENVILMMRHSENLLKREKENLKKLEKKNEKILTSVKKNWKRKERRNGKKDDKRKGRLNGTKSDKQKGRKDRRCQERKEPLMMNLMTTTPASTLGLLMLYTMLWDCMFSMADLFAMEPVICWKMGLCR